MTIQIPAILTGFSTKVDKTASLRFSTNEITENDLVELSRNQGQFGYVLFKPNTFSEKDLPAEQAEDKNKTPAKRLRAALYVLFQQETGKGTNADFEVYYRAKMEKLIEYIKNKLD